MKLHLPHRLQAALMAAIASVSFTTVSSATLAAGTFAFFAGQAGAEDLTHDPILTQQLDHAKKIEFGKLSLSETGAEQVEPSVAKSSFGSGDVTSVDAAATLGGDIVDAVLCEGYSEAGGSWQADAAALSAALDPAATSEFVTAEGLAAMENDEPVFSTAAAAAPAAATSALDLAPQQDNSYYGTTTAASTTAASGSTVSAPSVGGGAGAGSASSGSGYVAASRSTSRPAVMKTAGLSLNSGSAAADTQDAGESREADALSLELNESASPERSALRALGDVPQDYTRENVDIVNGITLAPGKNTYYYDANGAPNDAVVNVSGGGYKVALGVNGGDNSERMANMKLGATLTATTLWLQEGRYQYYGSTASNLSGISELRLDGGQLWVATALTYDGAVTLGTSTWSESTSQLKNAAMRIGAAVTFNGAMVVESNSKIGWYNGGNVTVNGDVSGSGNLTLQSNSATSLFFKGNTKLQASIINEANVFVRFDRSGDGKGVHTVNSIKSTASGGGVSIAANTSLSLVSGESSLNSFENKGTLTVASGADVAVNCIMTGSAGKIVVEEGGVLRNIHTSANSQYGNVINKISGEGDVYIGGVDGTFQYHDDTYMEEFAGTVHITGTWQAGNSSTRFRAAKSVIVETGGSVKAWGNNALSRSFVLNGGTLADAGGDETYSGAITVNADSKVDAASGKTVTLSGTITGAYDLTKTGAGTVMLSGDNRYYTGDIAIDKGTLKVGHNYALGSSDVGVSRTITVNAGGVLDVNGKASDADDVYTVTLNGGTLTNTGGGLDAGQRQLVRHAVLTADSGVVATSQFGITGNRYAATSLDLGTYTLKKTGNMIFRLSNTTVISSTSADGETRGKIQVSEGTLEFHQGGTFSADLQMDGGTVSGNGSGINLGSDIEVETTNSDSKLTASIVTDKYCVTFAGAENLTASGVIAGSGSLSKTGAGTLTLSGNNTFTGSVAVESGTLKLGSTTALGSASKSITVSPKGTIDINGQNANYSYTLSGGSLVNNGSATGSGTQTGGLALTANSSIGGSGDFSIYATGVSNVSLNGNTLTKTGTNTVTFDNSNIQGGGNGNLRVEQGQLAFSTGRGCVVATDITLAGGTLAGRVTLSGDHTVTAEKDTTLADGVEFNLDNTNVQFNVADGKTLTMGSLLYVDSHLTSGKSSISKTGQGTLVLSHAGNSYTGGTTVSEGTLEAGNATALGTGAVTLNGGTLDLSANSAYATGAITMSSGTLKLAGESMLTSTGSISLTGGTLDLSRLTLTEGTGQYTLATGSSVTLADSMAKSFTLGSGASADGYTLAVVDNNTLVLNYAATPTDLYWKGDASGNGTWNTEAGNKVWTNEAGTQTLAFPTEGTPDVHFVDVGSVDEETYSVDYAQVTLAEDVSVGTMYVSSSADGDTYLSIHSEGAYSIQAGKLSVSGNTALSTAVHVKAQDVEIGEDSAWRITGMEELDAAISGAGTVYKSGEDRLLLTGDNRAFTGKIIVETGTLAVGNANALGARTALEIGDSWGDKTTLELVKGVEATAGSLTMYANSTLLFEAGSSLTLSGDFDFGYDVDADNNVTFSFGEGFVTSSSTSPITLVTFGEGASFTESCLSYISLDGLADSLGAALDLQGSSIVLTFTPPESEGLIWRAQSGTWGAHNAWETAEGTHVTFETGDDVVVDAAHESVHISLFATAEAGEMLVKHNSAVAGQATVTIAETTPWVSLTTTSLELEAGTTLKAQTTMTVTDTVKLGSDSVLELESPQDVTLAAAVSTAEGATGAVIAKKGDKTLTLTGNNSGYAGNLVVEKGTLEVANRRALGTGTVTVKNGAVLTLDPDKAATGSGIALLDVAAPVSGHDMVLESGSTITFVGDTMLALDGALTLGDGVTFNLNHYGFTDDTAVTLITVPTLNGAANLASTVVLAPSYVENAYLAYTDGAVVLTFVRAAERELYWKGGLGNWSTSTEDMYWHASEDTAVLTFFRTNDSVVFDARAAASSVSVIDQDITAGNITVKNGTQVVLQSSNDNPATAVHATTVTLDGSLTARVDLQADSVVLNRTGVLNVDASVADRALYAALSGNGTLVKSSEGDLVLSGDNRDFSGSINVNAGKLVADSEYALGRGTTIKLGSGTELAGTVDTGVKVSNSTISTASAAAVTATLDIQSGTSLRFDGAGSIDVTGGSLTGSGSLVKDGFGTVTLGENVGYTGSTTVNAGTLAFTDGFDSKGDFILNIGSALKLGEQAEGTGTYVTYRDGKKVDTSTINFKTTGTLTLGDGTSLDMSNIQLNEYGVAGVAKFGSLDAVFADKIGDSGDAYYYKFVEGVSLHNLQGVGGNTYARLVYDEANKLVYVQRFGGDTNGLYWKGDAATGEGNWYRDSGNSGLWTTTQNGTEHKAYNWDRKVPMSAYFFGLTDSQGNAIEKATVTLTTSFEGGGDNHDKPNPGAGDVIIDGTIPGKEVKTKYTFVSTEDKYLMFNTQYPNALIVRSGSEAEFKFGIGMSNGSLLSVEKGASMMVDTTGKTSGWVHDGPSQVTLYNAQNEGTLDITAGSVLFKHVVNEGKLELLAYDCYYKMMEAFDWIYEGNRQLDRDGGIHVNSVYNAQGAVLSIAGDAVVANSSAGSQNSEIANDGTLEFNAVCLKSEWEGMIEVESDSLLVMVPVAGTGTVKTGQMDEKAKAVVFKGALQYAQVGASNDENWPVPSEELDECGINPWGEVDYYKRPSVGTVQAGNLELGAPVTTFLAGVEISGSTLVKAGKVANFYGGGIGQDEDGQRNAGELGALTLEAEARVNFGPQEGEWRWQELKDGDGNYVYETSSVNGRHLILDASGNPIRLMESVGGEVYELARYEAGTVVAAAGSVLTTYDGAAVKVDSINAASRRNTGNIVLGEECPDIQDGFVLPDNLPAASLLVSGVTYVDTVTVHSGKATLKGTANMNRIMQDGGELRLESGSVLNGSPVSEGSTTLTGGTVSGGVLVLDKNVTLTQNAVIDVRKPEVEAGDAFTYRVAGEETSMINASNLDLVVEAEDMKYREVVYSSTDINTTEKHYRSGFVSAGDEFVKLFDMDYQEGGKTTTLFSGGEQVYHSSASGMMTLIGDDNLAAIKELYSGTGYILDNYVGWAYLHAAQLGLETYYVRDTYTQAVTVRDAEVTPAEELNLAKDRVTLSKIFEASKGEEMSETPNLQKVVFDTTQYNQDKIDGHNGTLTVDVDTSVDLFAVAADTVASINITALTTVTADQHSAGVQGTLHLEGAGVYEVTGRNDLGTGISLRDNYSTEATSTAPEWDGTVRVTGTSTSLSVEELSVGEGADASTLEFKHWTGALESGEHSSDAKIVLTGTAVSAADPAAMDLLGTEGIAYAFTNSVTGANGRVKHSTPEEGVAGNVALAFTGDTSGWNGIYEQNTDTKDALTFTGGTEVNANVVVSQGDMALTYGGTVTTVNSDVTVYKGGEGATNTVVNYTGGEMTVAGLLYSDGHSGLTLNVGPKDGETDTVATFTGSFAGTRSSVMNVRENSTAEFGTAGEGAAKVEAELLRVKGDTGSNVGIAVGSKLVLTGKVPTGEGATYSEFHGLDNEGTLDMQAAGGDIRLVVDVGVTEPTFKAGNLVLSGETGKAAIETSANGQKVDVVVDSLTGPTAPGQVLLLDNQDGNGTVNYHLGGDTAYMGKVQFGSEDTTKTAGATNVVLESDGVAANSVLESVGIGSSASVVVNTANASVQGITSAADASVGGTLYGTGKNTAEGSSNNQVTITGSDTYSYNGGLGANLDIAYTGNGKQTFEGGASGFNGSVTVDNSTADAGVLEILNVGESVSMQIEDLTIGANNTLVAKQGANVGTADANVTVNGTLLAKGGSTRTPEGGSQTGSASRMDANLTLASGSTLNVAAAGGIGGLDLGGSLTIASGAMLSQADMATVWNMGVGDKYDLAFNVTKMSGFGDDVDWSVGVDASKVFNNGMAEGEFYIRYVGNGGNGSNVGQVFLYRLQTPEPTTGTLSLLALAALCARRRRKA